MNPSMRLKKEIIEMLQENTGRHFLDSGGVYGRHWERNAKLPNTIKFWDKTSLAWLNIHGGKNLEIFATISLYHHLVNSLIWDDEVTKINKMWDKFWKNDPDTYKPWDKLMEEFWNKAKDIQDYDFGSDYSILNSGYTYNNENSLSQDFAYILMGDWVFIQIHNGCDARGGFTVPKLFKFNEYSLHDIQDYSIGCANGHYWDYQYYNHYETETDFDFKSDEIVDYYNLEPNEQEHFDKFGYLIGEEEIVYATEGQVNLPGVEARLKKPEVRANILVIKDKEAFCPCCGLKLYANKYWSS